jgi:rhodanese-related sulfurtransferase
MAADALRASGFEAYSVDGGIVAWEAAGLPVERNT